MENEIRIKASVEERDSILKVTEETMIATQEPKKARMAGDKRALEIALRKKVEAGLDDNFVAVGMDEIPGKSAEDKGEIEFIYQAKKCDKDDKKKEDKKEEKKDTTVKKAGKDYAKLTADDIKDWQAMSEKFVAKHGVEEAVKLLSKEASEKNVERPITFAISLVDDVVKAVKKEVSEGEKQTKKLDKDTESAMNSQKKFTSSLIRKAKAFAYYCQKHSKNPLIKRDASRVLEIANTELDDISANGLHKRASDLYQTTIKEVKMEDKTGTQKPQVPVETIREFESSSKKLFASLQGDKITVTSALKVLNSLIGKIATAKNKNIDASEVRKLQVFANALEPLCVKASAEGKPEGSMLSDFVVLASSVKTALEEVDIDEANGILNDGLKEVEKEEKEATVEATPAEVVTNPTEPVVTPENTVTVEAAKKDKDDKEEKAKKEKKEKEEKEAKEKKEKEEKAKKEKKADATDPIEKVFTPNVPESEIKTDAFEKVNALKKSAVFDPAIQIPTEYETMVKQDIKGEPLMAQEEIKGNKDERINAQEDVKKKEEPMVKAVLGSEKPSEDRIQLAILKVANKNLFVNEASKIAMTNKLRTLNASQLDNFMKIADQLNPETSMIENGNVIDLTNVFESGVPGKQ